MNTYNYSDSEGIRSDYTNYDSYSYNTKDMLKLKTKTPEEQLLDKLHTSEREADYWKGMYDTTMSNFLALNKSHAAIKHDHHALEDALVGSIAVQVRLILQMVAMRKADHTSLPVSMEMLKNESGCYRPDDWHEFIAMMQDVDYTSIVFNRFLDSKSTYCLRKKNAAKAQLETHEYLQALKATLDKEEPCPTNVNSPEMYFARPDAGLGSLLLSNIGIRPKHEYRASTEAINVLEFPTNHITEQTKKAMVSFEAQRHAWQIQASVNRYVTDKLNEINRPEPTVPVIPDQPGTSLAEETSMQGLDPVDVAPHNP